MYYTGSNAFATLRQGLVGAWCPSLPNGGSGSTLPDVSGYNNHGVLTNMSPDDWVSGQYGRALDFDGVNDYVQSSGMFVNGTSKVSTSSWIKRTGNNTSGFGNGVLAVWQFQGGNGVTQFVLLFFNNQIRFTVSTSSNVGITASQTINLNEWYHVVGQYDGSSVQIFVNGVSGGSASHSGTVPASTSGFRIGAYGPEYSLCQLDDIRIYNRALSESEIKLLASRPGIGLRQESHRNTFYQFPSGARRKRILTGMP